MKLKIIILILVNIQKSVVIYFNILIINIRIYKSIYNKCKVTNYL